ncbi:MAG: hypothetical protein JWQ95_1540 [Sphaerisporangium sp.]|nr:hypothetical protein [Sphaerisporangium sp.]
MPAAYLGFFGGFPLHMATYPQPTPAIAPKWNRLLGTIAGTAFIWLVIGLRAARP